jgi:hypothetical protein
MTCQAFFKLKGNKKGGALLRVFHSACGINARGTQDDWPDFSFVKCSQSLDNLKSRVAYSVLRLFTGFAIAALIAW